MVINRGLLLLCALCFAKLTFASSVSLTIDSKQVEYGKSLKLTLDSNGAIPSLATFDLQSRLDDYVVAPLPADHDTQTAQLRRQWRLYPRRPGQLTIPAMHLGQARTAALNIEVTPAIDPRTGQPIRVSWSAPPVSVWVRQAVYLRMTLQTAASIVVLQREQFTDSSLTIHELNTVRMNTAEPDVGYRHQGGWAVIPRRQGSRSLQLPALAFVRDGIVTHRFYPPQLSLSVRPLPAYLPPGIPVGQLSLQPAEQQLVGFTDELAYLHIQLTGRGLMTDDMPLLENQLASSKELQIYPAKKSVKQLTDNGVLVTHIRYRIPVVAKSGGRVMFPALRLVYFDPEQGKIISRRIENPGIYSLSRILTYIIIGLGLVALLWLGRFLFPKLMAQLRYWQAYTALLSILPGIDNGDRLARLLREQACLEGWSAGNLTLAQWWKYWQQTYGDDQQLDQTLDDLMRHRYSAAPFDVYRARGRLVEAFSRNHPLLYRLARLRRLARQA